MNKITVIIPCYNGFKYMSNCLGALENQTYKDFEVIIVDDCSTDDSYECLLNYQKTTELNLRIIRNEKNLKSAQTRQVGVKDVQTEWLSFCDCDDWYENDFFEKMLSKAEHCNADIVMCHFNYAYADGSKKYLSGLNILNDQSTKNEYLAYSPMSLCRNIYKKQLFCNLSIPAINNAEDGALIPQLIAKCNKISIIHEGLYNYFIRSDSLSSMTNPSVYYDFLKAQATIDKEIGELYPRECEFIGIKNVCYGAILNALKANVSIGAVHNCYKEFYKKHRKWHKNSYIKSLGVKKKMFLLFLKMHMYLPLKVFAYLHQKLSIQ